MTEHICTLSTNPRGKMRIIRENLCHCQKGKKNPLNACNYWVIIFSSPFLDHKLIGGKNISCISSTLEDTGMAHGKCSKRTQGINGNSLMHASVVLPLL